MLLQSNNPQNLPRNKQTEKCFGISKTGPSEHRLSIYTSLTFTVSDFARILQCSMKRSRQNIKFLKPNEPYKTSMK